MQRLRRYADFFLLFLEQARIKFSVLLSLHKKPSRQIPFPFVAARRYVLRALYWSG
jgi:hypothetical protein